MEELHPTEIPLAFGVLFFLFSYSFFSFKKKSTRAFADSAEEIRHRGSVPPAEVPRLGPHGPSRQPWLNKSPDGVGRVSSFKRSFYFIILVFNCNHSAHIKESVFKNKP